jgi:hypothetical protein
MENPMVATTAKPRFGRRSVATLARSTKAGAAPRVADRTAITAEMVLAHIGRNKHKFEPTIEAMERLDPSFTKFTIGWSWPAFFVPVIWLAYRKMWAAAAIAYFLMIAVGYVAGNKAGISIVAYVVFAIYAKSFVVSHAAGRIRRILAREPNATVAAIAIRDEGGVSVGGAWIAIFLIVLPVIVVGLRVAAAAAQ